MTMTKFEPVAWTNKQGDYFEAVRKDTVFGSHTRPLYTSDQLAEAADEIERQAAQIGMMREAIRFWMAAEGDYDMIKAGKIFTKALSTTPDQALEQFAAKVREQCAKVCDEHADDPVYCGTAIRAIKELPK